MNKILLIIQREYLVRVRKKSFLVMSIVGPVLLGLLMVVPVWLATMNNETQTIEVLDESGFFMGKLEDTEEHKFVFVGGPLEQAKTHFLENEADALLHIPKIDLTNPEGIRLFSASGLSLTTQTDLQRMLRTEIEEQRFKDTGVDKEVLEKIKTPVSFTTVNLSAEGEKASNSAVSTGVGMFAAVLIYFFIFLYGVQIMRGVIEEKTNRIVEVIISSVKPFQLMMGKIIGIALVGFTQLLIWVVLSFTIVTFVSKKYQVDRFSDNQIEKTLETTSDVNQAQEMNKIVSALDSIPVATLLASFLFYFIGGYLLYGSLFGAIGAAVDNETDTQQFMLPITIPLILSIVVAQGVIMKDPNGTLAFWLSIIPFTSPVVMMVRLPFGVPTWELMLSMGLLVLGFVFTTWLAARIYRVGILMYGKKPTYAELSKWLFYRT